MSDLFSTSWYRVADAVPRLRTQARVFRHVYRGEVWHLVQDLGSGKFLRLNPAAYHVVALIDGVRPLEEIWQHACEALGEEAPSQDDVIHLLGQLHQANVLVSNRLPDIEELEERRERNWKQRLKQYIANPMALRFPLIDPDRFLTRLMPLFPRWALPWMLLVWLALVGMGLFLTLRHWGDITADITRLIFTPEYVLMLLIVFPLLKAIHEIGHGIAIKLFGGQCHEMGMMLLVLMPIPYVDASHATAFLNKYQRILVGGAGMMIELAIASVALWLWTMAEPGLMRVFLHEVVLVAGVSTLLFNINPLLRLDGYYMLSDWLEIPNLGQKSNRYFGHVLKKYVLRAKKHLNPPETEHGEAPWLFSYSVLSFLYRMFIVTVIVLFVAQQLFFIGMLLAAWAIYMMLVLPLGKSLKAAWFDPALAEKRGRLVSASTGFVLVMAYLILLVPLPAATAVEGVTWMSERSQLRAPASCFGLQVLANPGPVMRGQPLVVCEDELLDMALAELQAKRDEHLADLARADRQDRVLAMNIREELAYTEASIADLQRRLANLEVLSPHAGRFVLASRRDFVGRFWQRGDIMGYVVDPERFTLMVVVPQRDANRVREDLRKVSLQAADTPGRLHSARLVREVPAATDELPSMALSLQGGGRIGVNPQPDSEGMPRALQQLFVLELTLDDPEPISAFLGQRVHVRFAHSPEPLGRQIYRVVRDVFAERFLI
ncbi:PqqD family peptide modification chaperone [Ectothiorhodosinus mongolicus]|nr:PqqD family peptide modification chaperone [Ectothiorhodosinus mongolicus]ULX56238.1 PqqD family peptide modification chaperone [Ectothiorhodosinus mongolicus]